MFKCYLTGYLGKDPHSVRTSDGTCMVYLNVGTKVYAGAKQHETLWVSVSVFNKSAEFVLMYAKKGDHVLVSGRMDHPTIWDSSEGPRVNFKCTSEYVEILNKPTQYDKPIKNQQETIQQKTESVDSFDLIGLQGAKIISRSEHKFDADIPF